VSNVLFDHIAIGVPRMADAPAVLAGVLGGVPTDGVVPRLPLGRLALRRRR
jgi:hypothetical protein